MWWDRDPSVSRRPSQPFRPLSPRLCSTRPPVRLFEPAPAPASIRFVKFTKRVSSIRLAYLVLWHRCVGTPCNGVVSSSLTSRFHQALGIYQAPHDVDHDLFGATTASGLIYLEIVSFDPFWHKMTRTANNTYDTNGPALCPKGETQKRPPPGSLVTSAPGPTGLPGLEQEQEQEQKQ